jgi:hypothetical protein
MKNRNIILITVLLALGCVAHLRVVQAASPLRPEDRGNGNSAGENIHALNPATTGWNNTAHGWFSLFSNTTATGNTATGFQALYNNTTGPYNTATGVGALGSNTTADSNTADGAFALRNNTTGTWNTAIGAVALESNTEGQYNTATGFRSMNSNTTGCCNAAYGMAALQGNTTGRWNSAFGLNAMYYNITGETNTAIGFQALMFNTSGNENVALGDEAGYNQTTGSGNIYIGAGMRGVAGESYTCYIGNIVGQTSSGGTPVYINSAGKLGTTTSSRRFKEDIKPMNNLSEALFGLRPVTFRYKQEIDPQGIPQFGLVAEDVEKVNPDLVVRDKEGKVNTVRYEQINAMLLNEFLKEHKAFVEEQEKVKKLEAGLAGLLATVKEQAAQIEKVSAQLQVRHPRLSLARINP